MGQRNYFTTSVTLLYKLPLLAALSIPGNNNVIYSPRTGPSELSVETCHNMRLS